MNGLVSFLKYAAIAVWSLFVAAPLLWAVTTSFKTANGVTGSPVNFAFQYCPARKAGFTICNMVTTTTD